MTSKKSTARKHALVLPSTKLNAATLRNMAHHSVSLAADNDVDSAAPQPIAGTLSKLSPLNLHLLEKIICVIIDEQENKIP